ncbi:MAG: M3 family oligoendopeptidase [Bacteroidota bacterium]
MKFDEFDYRRPSMEVYRKKFETLVDEFRHSSSVERQHSIIEQINALRVEFSSMFNICHVRHTIDTRDEFYENEKTFFDQNNPMFESMVHSYYGALMDSPFRKELEAKWGKQLFVIAELNLKTFSEDIMEDLQEENRLVSEYVKLKAGAQIEFEGKTYNLTALVPLESGKDRRVRKASQEAHWRFFEEHSEAFEQLYDQLVKVRHRIARKLGYNNFVELGYDRLLRSDYNAADVARFRQQVIEHIVPLVNNLTERQRKRLGLDNMKFYDLAFKFTSGNPKPKGEPKWIVENARQMYADLSEETKTFFDFMSDNELMDLVNKEGKATGGYCTFIPNQQAPFIFSNFNGTSGDINVLTHEAGHAFQVYSSRDVKLKEYAWPTYEACEIHSMSMEFFTWPWMHLFFEEETEKFRFSHMDGALRFLPYGAAVDEFQHFAYENPDATAAERNQAWRNIEQKYMPYKDYNGNEFLQSGRFWLQQSHIFSVPFYYIDYALAQICAFQFWNKSRQDNDKAWSDYLRLCKAGGSLSFLQLVSLAGLQSPFDNGCLESNVQGIQSWLDSVDDRMF